MDLSIPVTEVTLETGKLTGSSKKCPLRKCEGLGPTSTSPTKSNLVSDSAGSVSCEYDSSVDNYLLSDSEFSCSNSHISFTVLSHTCVHSFHI